MITTIWDLTATHLIRLYGKDINKRELRREIKKILAMFAESRDTETTNYIKRLEKEVEDYRTLKKLLK